MRKNVFAVFTVALLGVVAFVVAPGPASVRLGQPMTKATRPKAKTPSSSAPAATTPTAPRKRWGLD